MKRTRRDVLVTAARLATLGLLAGGTGMLVSRPKKLDRCLSDGICTSCQSLDACGLPQALSAKKGLGRTGGRG